ncbi:hypothetical protein AAFF_G00016790 [Aldrovandia affinis]|uniref:Uncharacterized protein n=1 Tax=Aldrovandia affinis TaxID=143900 RepID=A0AAD7WH55_9TELE|nr:hypothetical protein AAFF_G00016790 [Aldrovandia affinis]
MLAPADSCELRVYDCQHLGLLGTGQSGTSRAPPAIYLSSRHTLSSAGLSLYLKEPSLLAAADSPLVP